MISIVKKIIKLSHPPRDNAYGMDSIPNPANKGNIYWY
jgi:hypothetical protein